MFGLGGSEVLLIFVLALLVFGPRKLPEIGRTIGRTLAEFRKATQDFRVSLEREVDLEEVKNTRREIEQATTFEPPQGPRPASDNVPTARTPTTFAELAAAQRASEAEAPPPDPSPVEDERARS